MYLIKLQLVSPNKISTTDACMILKEVVSYNTGKKSKVYANFIDLSKAFDMVDHFILGEKLLNSGLPYDIVIILCRYLRNQSARITWKGKCGNYKHIDQGVRQGGILSPFLFNFYINSIIDNISSLQVGCRLGLARINIILYADDVVLLTNSLEDSNLIYKKFKCLVEKIKLKINETKSKCLVFRKNKNVSNELHCNLLDTVDEYVYLGHCLKYNLDDSNDIKIKLNKFYSSFHSFYRSLND